MEGLSRYSLRSIIAALCLSALLVFVLGFLVGSRYFGAEMKARTILDLQSQQQNALLDEQAADLLQLRVISEIDRQALEKVRRTIVGLDRELSSQSEELKLYRKLLNTDRIADGLHILNVGIKPGAEPSVFNYSFVIRQKARLSKSISAAYSVQVEGQQGPEIVRYSFNEAGDVGEAKSVRVKLKYFRVIEGEIKLPGHFVAQKLIVNVWLTRSPKKRREQVSLWPELVPNGSVIQ